MNKHYTKKQICEAIAYWKKQLKKLDEHVFKLSVDPKIDAKFGSLARELAKKVVHDEEDVDVYAENLLIDIDNIASSISYTDAADSLVALVKTLIDDFFGNASTSQDAIVLLSLVIKFLKTGK